MQKQAAEKKQQLEYERKEKLIEQARAAYAAKKNPAPVVESGMLTREFGVMGLCTVPGGSVEGVLRVNVVDKILYSFLAVVADVDSPDFDLEKFLSQLEESK